MSPPNEDPLPADDPSAPVAGSDPAAAPSAWVDRPDDELAAACIAGDDDAWTELVGRYGRLVYSIPRRHGLPEDQCWEVYQQVFLAAVGNLAGLRERRSLAKWLITASLRWTWRVERAERGPVPTEAGELDPAHDPPVGSDDAAPAEIVEAWERRQALRSALRRLGPPCEELLSALHLHGEAPDYRKVARRLGRPVGSIGPTRARCLERLRRLLESRASDRPK